MITISCPKCESVSQMEPVQVILPDSIELDALLRSELNQVTCEECGNEIFFDAPVLYRDDVNQLLIYYIPADQCPEIPVACEKLERLYEEVFAELHSQHRPDCRLVTSQQRMIEKIALLRDSFNDRLIEYVKHMLFEHNPGLKPEQHEMLYDFTQDGEENIVFHVFDKTGHEHVYTVEFRMEDYARLEDHYFNDGDARDHLDALFPSHHVQVDELFENMGSSTLSDQLE